MAVTTGKTFGKLACEALGLNPSMTANMVIRIPANDEVSVEVTTYVKDGSLQEVQAR
jgi:hypothetical protein